MHVLFAQLLQAVERSEVILVVCSIYGIDNIGSLLSIVLHISRYLVSVVVIDGEDASCSGRGGAGGGGGGDVSYYAIHFYFKNNLRLRYQHLVEVV